MPRLLVRQQPSGRDPEPTLVDGLLVNGRDAMAEKRAAHRARLEAERAAQRPQTMVEPEAETGAEESQQHRA